MKDILIRVLVFITIPFYIALMTIISIFGIAYDMALSIGKAIRKNDRPSDN